MNASRILWGQVLTVCSIAFAFIWAATQWTAAQLGSQAQLGHPWFMAGRYPVYHPPAFFWWWFAYDAYAPHVFQTGLHRRGWHAWPGVFSMNAVEIEEAVSALAERPFDAAEFPFAFLEAFGNKATTIKRLRRGVSNRSALAGPRGSVRQTNNIHIAVANPAPSPRR